MKKKIRIYLITLFVIFVTGTAVAVFSTSKSTAVFNNLLKLHQIESLRNNLVQRVLKVQSDLYKVNTSFNTSLEDIIFNVENLEESAAKCTSCHHEAEVESKLLNIQLKIEEFKNSLSFYITASADSDRIEALKQEAAAIGDEILFETERMSKEASRSISGLTGKALGQIDRAKMALLSFLAASALFAIVIAGHLTRSVTVPISKLVMATRKITKGEMGYVLEGPFNAEFGELASHFNSMSISLKNGYDKLQREILERRETEEALRRSEERYAIAALGANDGLWDWDLGADTIYFSPRWKSMLGYEDGEVGVKPECWMGLVHPDDREKLAAKIASHLDGRNSHLEDEHRVLHKDGLYRWMLVRGIAVRDSSSRAYRMAGSQTDVTGRKKAEEQLIYDAFHDALTGLPNRALFMNRLEHVINAARRRSNYLFAVLFLDLDRFKYINDSLGHLAGDELLVSVGQRLSGYLRPNDTVARFGGDEFAILLEDIRDGGDAERIARRIQEELPLPMAIGGHEVFATASIGIAMGTGQYERPDHLLRDADLAMYHAKANGKGRFEVFDPFMLASTTRHLQLETDLRRAIERQEFRLYYQPVFSLGSRRIAGFEALLRWEHPSRGLVGPSEFITVAEETGLITSIGQWVLREACSKASELAGQFPPLSMSVNFSSKEFTPLLIQNVSQIFSEFDLAPSVLRFEITERTIMNNPETAAIILTELKDIGVDVFIDDFGTGYSSLSYLHQFSVDGLKIDRSFVNNINSKRENFEIVKAIISLAGNMNLKVVAEGIETEEEADVLAGLGCELVQGNFFCKPVEMSEVEALIGAEKSISAKSQTA